MRTYRVENAEKIAERERAYRAANLEKITERQRAYRAANQEKQAATYRAWRAANPGYDAAWRAANPEKVAAYYRAYQTAHPEKAAAKNRNRKARKKGNGGTHTAADIQDQYDRQKGRCYYCKKKVGDTYHVDHVVPLAKGGSNGPENLVVTCPECNLAKGSQHPAEFAGIMF